MKIVQIAIGDKFRQERCISQISIIESMGKNHHYHMIKDGKFALLPEFEQSTRHSAEATTPHEASALKLKIIDIIKPKEGELVLFLDTDVLMVRPLPDLEPKDKIMVYGYPNRSQAEPSFAGFLLNEPRHRPFLREHIGINAGILLFRNVEPVRQLFKMAHLEFTEDMERGKVSPCWEQPYLCRELIETERYDTSLTPYVTEARSSGITENTVFHHYCGLRGLDRANLMRMDYENYKRMK
jgi:hypothetical protein